MPPPPDASLAVVLLTEEIDEERARKRDEKAVEVVVAAEKKGMTAFVVHFGRGFAETPPLLSSELTNRASVTLVALPHLSATVGAGEVPMFLEVFKETLKQKEKYREE